MKTDGILTIGVLLLILWLAISKVNGKSRLSLLLTALGIGGTGESPKGSLATRAVDAWGNAVTIGEADPTSHAPIQRAPNMVNPVLGGIPPVDDMGLSMVSSVPPSSDYYGSPYIGPVSSPPSSSIN